MCIRKEVGCAIRDIDLIETTTDLPENYIGNYYSPTGNSTLLNFKKNSKIKFVFCYNIDFKKITSLQFVKSKPQDSENPKNENSESNQNQASSNLSKEEDTYKLRYDVKKLQLPFLSPISSPKHDNSENIRKINSINTPYATVQTFDFQTAKNEQENEIETIMEENEDDEDENNNNNNSNTPITPIISLSLSLSQREEIKEEEEKEKEESREKENAKEKDEEIKKENEENKNGEIPSIDVSSQNLNLFQTNSSTPVVSLLDLPSKTPSPDEISPIILNNNENENNNRKSHHHHHHHHRNSQTPTSRNDISLSVTPISALSPRTGSCASTTTTTTTTTTNSEEREGSFYNNNSNNNNVMIISESTTAFDPITSPKERTYRRHSTSSLVDKEKEININNELPPAVPYVFNRKKHHHYHHHHHHHHKNKNDDNKNSENENEDILNRNNSISANSTTSSMSDNSESEFERNNSQNNNQNIIPTKTKSVSNYEFRTGNNNQFGSLMKKSNSVAISSTFTFRNNNNNNNNNRDRKNPLYFSEKLQSLINIPEDNNNNSNSNNSNKSRFTSTVDDSYLNKENSNIIVDNYKTGIKLDYNSIKPFLQLCFLNDHNLIIHSLNYFTDLLSFKLLNEIETKDGIKLLDLIVDMVTVGISTLICIPDETFNVRNNNNNNKTVIESKEYHYILISKITGFTVECLIEEKDIINVFLFHSLFHLLFETFYTINNQFCEDKNNNNRSIIICDELMNFLVDLITPTTIDNDNMSIQIECDANKRKRIHDYYKHCHCYPTGSRSFAINCSEFINKIIPQQQQQQQLSTSNSSNNNNNCQIFYIYLLECISLLRIPITEYPETINQSECRILGIELICNIMKQYYEVFEYGSVGNEIFHSIIFPLLMENIFCNSTVSGRIINGLISILKLLFSDYRKVFRIEITYLSLSLLKMMLICKQSLDISDKLEINNYFLDLIEIPSNVLEIYLNYDNIGLIRSLLVESVEGFSVLISEINNHIHNENDSAEKDDIEEIIENSIDYIIIITKLIMNISGTYEYERMNNNSIINIPHSNASYAVNGNKKSIRYQSIRVSERRQTIDFNDFGLDLPQSSTTKTTKNNNNEENSINTEINNDIYIINALKIINEKKNVKKGIEYLNREGMIDKNEKEIVKFLRLYQNEIDDEALGEYLGEPGENEEESKFYTKIRELYLDYNYASKTFEEGLRFMLTQGGFKLPGESQKIERFVEAFAKDYYEEHKTEYKNSDTVMVLAYSTIMLNTDAHNPNVRKDRKMKRDEFISQNRGIDDGDDLPKEMLGDLYDKITNNEIQIPRNTIDSNSAKNSKNKRENNNNNNNNENNSGNNENGDDNPTTPLSPSSKEQKLLLSRKEHEKIESHELDMYINTCLALITSNIENRYFEYTCDYNEEIIKEFYTKLYWNIYFTIYDIFYNEMKMKVEFIVKAMDLCSYSISCSHYLELRKERNMLIELLNKYNEYLCRKYKIEMFSQDWIMFYNKVKEFKYINENKNKFVVDLQETIEKLKSCFKKFTEKIEINELKLKFKTDISEYIIENDKVIIDEVLSIYDSNNNKYRDYSCFLLKKYLLIAEEGFFGKLSLIDSVKLDSIEIDEEVDDDENGNGLNNENNKENNNMTVFLINVDEYEYRIKCKNEKKKMKWIENLNELHYNLKCENENEEIFNKRKDIMLLDSLSKEKDVRDLNIPSINLNLSPTDINNLKNKKKQINFDLDTIKKKHLTVENLEKITRIKSLIFGYYHQYKYGDFDYNLYVDMKYDSYYIDLWRDLKGMSRERCLIKLCLLLKKNDLL